ncbi:hypothetical protein F5148DRAFT_13493 [Russula earlei]|uniref:Uncharacterized protein n=1 Tax=Russula earlei TaxID=71964 RepID=A0ACC0UKQ8_9AGAM|nr:hypothetical protein F5148DRAFT_13493 [Russula earlei]
MSNLLPNPQSGQSGSADPSASLPALWGYIQPALDHIIRSPTNNLSKAPAVDVHYHMGIHTALYNYFTNHATAAPPPPGPPPPSHPAKGASAHHPTRGSSAALPLGHDVYDRLDAYFADVAREVLIGAPLDDSALVHYLVPCFIRYSAGAQSIHRLLNYVNRQYVRRAVDEDKGWLRFGDIISSELAVGLAAGIGGPGDNGLGGAGSHRRIAEKMRERRAAELRRWGAPDGGTVEQLALAEACAEAASSPERVVPVLSLAYRRFRAEVLEPLLAVPNSKCKGRKMKKGKQTGGWPVTTTEGTVDSDAGANRTALGPRGRLARSVKELLESKGGDEEEQNRLACEMADMLMRVGVRPDHPLRRRLRKFCVVAT